MSGVETVLKIRVSEEARARLDCEARRLGISASELVRMAIDRFLAETVDPDPRSLYDRVKEHIGVWDSGIPDRASNAKHYLREHYRKEREKRSTSS